MHEIYFVVVEATSSKQARQIATDELFQNSFISGDGYFSGGKADWFVIGGRWSGELASLWSEFLERVKKEMPPKHEFGWSDQEMKKNKKKLQDIWKSIGGKGLNPFNRDSYRRQGYADDAMVITPELLRRLRENCPEVEVFIPEEREEITVAELEAERVDGKYLVVVDYHC